MISDHPNHKSKIRVSPRLTKKTDQKVIKGIEEQGFSSKQLQAIFVQHFLMLTQLKLNLIDSELAGLFYPALTKFDIAKE